LCRVGGIDVKTAEQIRNNYDLDLGQKELEKAAKSGVTILSLWDKEFPYLLKKIYDPPALLYCRGLPMLTKEDCIAIVRKRAITSYGRSVTKQLAADLSVAGLTTVSGMARWIDTASHKATLEAGGRTIAVLAVVWIAFILLKISSLCRILYRKERSCISFRDQAGRWKFPGAEPHH
jgi:DNA processing protein